MSNTPFDLEAAKRGEKVQYQIVSGEWRDAHFVGTLLDGTPVFQYTHLGNGTTFIPSNPRIKPAPMRMVKLPCGAMYQEPIEHTHFTFFANIKSVYFGNEKNNYWNSDHATTEAAAQAAAALNRAITGEIVEVEV